MCTESTRVEDTGFFIPHPMSPAITVCSSVTSVAMINNRARITWGRKVIIWFILPGNSSLLKRSEGRNSVRGHRRTLLTGFSPMTCHLLSHIAQA